MRTELWDLYRTHLAGAVFTDLTHAFHPGIPHWSGFADEVRHEVFDHERTGYQVDRHDHVGQWGTHVDAPLHFVRGGRALDAIEVREMLLPLVVLDISDRVAADPDATPTPADLARWQERYGAVPRGAFVALRTDWWRRWPDPVRFVNRDADGVGHTPGWSRAVLEALFERHGATAIGHEQLDTDPGTALAVGDVSLEDYVLRRDRWQIEVLAHLDAVPAAGALVMVSWPKPLRGSGFPARVVAIHQESS